MWEKGSFVDERVEGSDGMSSESEIRMARLVRTIEGEIVPRLVMTRRVVVSKAPGASAATRVPDVSDVKELVRILLAHDVAVASAYVATVRQRGATLEMICLQLLAQAARELGLLWEEDQCDFMQVTVGVCRLHQLLRELSPEFGSSDVAPRAERRILLVPMPGEQHTFGMTLVAQFLRRSDWDVWHEFPGHEMDILEIVQQNWFMVVGLSVGTDARIEDVAAVIADIRKASKNRAVGILVGGPLLVEKPEVAELVGADATAADGPQAVMRAENFCSAILNSGRG